MPAVATNFPAIPYKFPQTDFIVSQVCNPLNRYGNCWVIITIPATRGGIVATGNYLEKYKIIGSTGRKLPYSKKDYLPTFYLDGSYEGSLRTAELIRHYRQIKPFPKNHYYWTIEANFRSQQFGGITIKFGSENKSFTNPYTAHTNNIEPVRRLEAEPEPKIKKQEIKTIQPKLF